MSIKIFLIAVVLFFTQAHCQFLTCYPSQYALEHLDNTAENSDFYIWIPENATRGMLILPDNGVHGASYAPYASAMYDLGYYVVLAKSITGLSEDEVFAMTMRAFDTELDLLHWSIMGNRLAAKIARIDNGRKLTGLVLLGDELTEDISDELKRISTVVYALNDTVVTPENVRLSLSENASVETGVLALNNTGHYDLVFSTCTGNEVSDSLFRFESYSIPSFDLPPRYSHDNVINGEDSIVRVDGERVRNCRSVSVEIKSGDSWTLLTTRTLKVDASMYEMDIIADTYASDYELLKLLLNNKRVRMNLRCGNHHDKIEFNIGEVDEEPSVAELNQANVVSQMSSVMSFNMMRNPDFRGNKLKADLKIMKPSTDVNRPIPLQFNVWEPEVSNGIGIYYLTGAGVNAEGGYAGLATLFKNAGYTFIVPTASTRVSMSVAPLSRSVTLDPQFSHIDKWVVGGHSMGGSAAFLAATINPSFEAIVSHAGKVSGNYVNDPRPVLQVWGSLDTANGESSRFLNDFGLYNPNTTEFVEIMFANHYYIGDYVADFNADSLALISRHEQQEAFFNATHEFLQRVLA